MRKAGSYRRVTVLILSAAIAVGLPACRSGGSPDSSVTPTAQALASGSIGALQSGATPLQLIVASSVLPTGKSLLTFGLVTQKGELLLGGSPEVWLAPDATSPAAGPFTATAYQFSPQFDDKAPRTPITGFYSVPVDIPTAGTWSVAAVATPNGTRAVGIASLPVTDGPVVGAVGSKAISVKTPVGTTDGALKEICTRPPPDPMHYISLDMALANGKPTVVNFGTPLLCESRLCGPVVDEQLAVFEKVGAERANFVHVEEFLPGPDLVPPEATAENASPGFKAWHLETEPWVFVIDGNGSVRARFEGPVVAAQIDAALQPLL
jgi:hypothetical protein